MYDVQRGTIRQIYLKGDNHDHPYYLFYSRTDGSGSPDLRHRAETQKEGTALATLPRPPAHRMGRTPQRLGLGHRRPVQH
jgi:hypothetical protein